MLGVSSLEQREMSHLYPASQRFAKISSRERGSAWPHMAPQLEADEYSTHFRVTRGKTTLGIPYETMKSTKKRSKSNYTLVLQVTLMFNFDSPRGIRMRDAFTARRAQQASPQHEPSPRQRS